MPFPLLEPRDSADRQRTVAEAPLGADPTTADGIGSEHLCVDSVWYHADSLHGHSNARRACRAGSGVRDRKVRTRSENAFGTRAEPAECVQRERTRIVAPDPPDDATAAASKPAYQERE
jgi:hypothetical protein